MKTVLLLIVSFVFTVSVYTQNPVQITGGKLDITTGGANISGTAVMQSSMFTSSSFLHSTSSPWRTVCQKLDCRPGGEFSTPNGLQIGDNGHRFGDFTINGTTYNGVYFNGGFQLDSPVVQIPRIHRRKGLIVFRRAFKLDGFLSVCRIDDFASGCPANDILFRGNITGHGDLTITMRVVQTQIFDRTYVSLKPLRFEYEFKP